MSLPDNTLIGHCAQSGRKILPVCLDQALCFSAGRLREESTLWEQGGPREGVSRETPPLPPPPPLQPSVEDDWGGPATEPPVSLLSSASSDDFCKGKAEDRYSLGSSLDSGMRTPLCRICFQGPEQVRPFSPLPTRLLALCCL